MYFRPGFRSAAAWIPAFSLLLPASACAGLYAGLVDSLPGRPLGPDPGVFGLFNSSIEP